MIYKITVITFYFVATVAIPSICCIKLLHRYILNLDKKKIA